MRALALLLALAAGPAAAQDTLHLPALQRAAIRHDPRLRQVELREAETELRLRTLAAERLPQLAATGEASTQSEVGSIPLDLPGAEIPTPPKTRIEAALAAELLLYDGGALDARREAERARLAAERAEIAAALYPLRTEVAQSYFQALLLQEGARETAALIDELRVRLGMVRAQVRAGTALPGDTAALRAEMLRATQQRDELAADRAAALARLSELTGREVGGADVLALPELARQVERAAAGAGAHPRYAVFAARRAALERQEAVIGTQTRPRATAFGRVAYGRPGLQQFTDRLHEYWIAGVRVRWTPWDHGASRREREALRIQRAIVDTEEAAFTAALGREVERPLAAIDRLRGTLETDDRIIVLREQIVRQARAQLAERAITAAAYVDALTDLEAARLARLRHRVELARARADYLGILGVELQ